MMNYLSGPKRLCWSIFNEGRFGHPFTTISYRALAGIDLGYRRVFGFVLLISRYYCLVFYVIIFKFIVVGAGF